VSASGAGAHRAPVAGRYGGPSAAGGEGVWQRVLEAIGEAERRDLLRVAVRRRFGRNEVVFHEGDAGDALHIVTAGVFIARSSSTLGEVVGVNMIGPGDVFGELALLTADNHRTATIVAVQGGATLMLARGHFEDLRARNPRIDRFLVSVLAERNRRLNAHLVELQFTPVEQRVYRRLLEFSRAVAAHGDEWVLLSQNELAMLAGTTRSTANRMLRRAASRGAIELARGSLRVLDEAVLEALAGEDR
jgi:CRP/FNR family transcriptional regulator, cyclic AMP receptor protein